jgi:GT2 family glycosyltransferase
VAFNDVDFCLRLGERGLGVVYTPHAVLTHHESASRGALHPRSEYLFMRRRWGELVARGDPFYNPNLTLDREDFGIDV